MNCCTRRYSTSSSLNSDQDLNCLQNVQTEDIITQEDTPEVATCSPKRSTSQVPPVGQEERNCFSMIQTKETKRETIITDFDVKDWTMVLRENDIAMEEYNVKTKELKIRSDSERESKEIQMRERRLKERQIKIEKERKLLEAQKKQIEERNHRRRSIGKREDTSLLNRKLSEEQRKLKKTRSFDIQEKSAVLEIKLKVNEKEETIALRLKLAENENQRLVNREKELVDREAQFSRQQNNLSEKELQQERKRSITEISINLNKLR